jgi:hypothetical protein
MTRIRPLLAALLVWLTGHGGTVPVLAQGSTAAHVHGEARLELALDARGFEVRIWIPMESLIGYERAPRSAQEIRDYESAIDRLRTTDGVMRPSTGAGCSGRLLELIQPDWATVSNGHAEMAIAYRFECSEPARLAALELMLFDRFSRLRSIDARLVDQKGARAQRLGRRTRILKIER